ncbi:hypothetical protein IAR50_005702 [Cryptococcus sp. DSM 104548]
MVLRVPPPPATTTETSALFQGALFAPMHFILPHPYLGFLIEGGPDIVIVKTLSVDKQSMIVIRTCDFHARMVKLESEFKSNEAHNSYCLWQPDLLM